MKDALIFSKQHETYEDIGTYEEIIELDRELSQTQNPHSMRLPQNTSQTINPHAPKEQICTNTLDLQNVVRKEDDHKSLLRKESHFEHDHMKSTHEKPNYVDYIFTFFPQECPNITPKKIQENQDIRKLRIECLSQTSEDSRVKLGEP
jgi:hypothetical protein